MNKAILNRFSRTTAEIAPIVLYGAPWCSMVLHCALWCSIVFHCALWCSMVLHCALLYSIVLYGALLWNDGVIVTKKAGKTLWNETDQIISWNSVKHEWDWTRQKVTARDSKMNLKTNNVFLKTNYVLEAEGTPSSSGPIIRAVMAKRRKTTPPTRVTAERGTEPITAKLEHFFQYSISPTWSRWYLRRNETSSDHRQRCAQAVPENTTNSHSGNVLEWIENEKNQSINQSI